MDILKMPESTLCMEVYLFEPTIKCPYLNDEVTLKPLCTKYGQTLTWNISGKIKKCPACNYFSAPLSFAQTCVTVEA